MRRSAVVLALSLIGPPGTFRAPHEAASPAYAAPTHIYVVKPQFALTYKETILLENARDDVVILLREGLQKHFPDLNVTLIGELDQKKAEAHCKEATVSCDIVVFMEKEKTGSDKAIEVFLVGRAGVSGNRSRRPQPSDRHDIRFGEPQPCNLGTITDEAWVKCRSKNLKRELARQLGEHHKTFHNPDKP